MSNAVPLNVRQQAWFDLPKNEWNVGAKILIEAALTLQRSGIDSPAHRNLSLCLGPIIGAALEGNPERLAYSKALRRAESRWYRRLAEAALRTKRPSNVVDLLDWLKTRTRAEIEKLKDRIEEENGR
jgi:hypothetical protein